MNVILLWALFFGGEGGGGQRTNSMYRLVQPKWVWF